MTATTAANPSNSKACSRSPACNDRATCTYAIFNSADRPDIFESYS